MSYLATTLKVLSDPTRLRILRMLSREELSVGELARVIAMSQSRVSNHLKVLRESAMLEERREGASVRVRLATGKGLPDELWTAIEPRLADLEECQDDLERLTRVLDERRQRTREYFDRVAQDWDVLGSDFRRGTARWRAVSQLVPRHVVAADLGCGTGYVTRALLQRMDRVICVDHSSKMLDEARKSLEAYADRVEFRPGELEELPLADEEVDAVFCNMVFHHVPDVVAALREIKRVLKPGGRMVVTDLLPHRESWMNEEMADLRLGLDPMEFARQAQKAGFQDVVAEDLNDCYVVKDPAGKTVDLAMFLVAGRRVQP